MLEQLGAAMKVTRVRETGEWMSTALPFESLYQAALHEITADLDGITAVVVRLGPFGGARAVSADMILWALAWTAAIIAFATWRLRRTDF
jgi:hypothetical protein